MEDKVTSNYLLEFSEEGFPNHKFMIEEILIVLRILVIKGKRKRMSRYYLWCQDFVYFIYYKLACTHAALNY